MMNHWKKCLQCWIPVSKKNDKKSVINNTGGTDVEADDLDRRSSSVSFDHPRPQQQFPIPYRRSSAVTTPVYMEDSHFWSAPPPPPPPPTQYTPVSLNDSSENYIPLDECLSGTSRQPRTLPKLVPRDIHLLDRVPPSPCSLTENSVSLSGMPEVYAPMPLSRSLIGPPSLSPRMNSRGGVDGSRRNHQGQSARRDPSHELGAFEGSPSPNQRVADMRNNNNSTCFNFKTHEHGRLVNSRSDPKARGAYSSVSSEASLPGDPGRPCCPSRALDSHSAILPHHDRPPECLHYRNISCNNSVDRKGFLVNQHSLPLTINGGCSATMGMATDDLLPPRNGHAAEVSSTALGGHSLDSKILHMTPPAPPPSNSTTVNGVNSKAKAHKYVNGAQRSAPQEGPDSCLSTPSYSESEAVGLLPPTASQAGINDSDGYYNLIPTNNPYAKTENGEERTTPPPPLPPPCHGPSSSRKKQFQKKPHLRHDSPHRRSPHSGAVALPQRARRREWSRTADDDSSSSYDDEGSSSGFSATNSNTSLNRPGDLSLLKCFTTKPPAPPQQPSIEYLTLDLDQPGVIAKGSPGTIHRSQNNSTIDYIEIDPCRTKALSDTRRQLESNRHKTSSH